MSIEPTVPDALIVQTLSRTIDPAHPLPVYLQLAATVSDEILAGRLPLGARLPSVRALGRRLDLNYHTVRHAWALLAEQGVLSVRRGLGARVVAVPAAAEQWRLTPVAAPPRARDPVAWVVSPVWQHAAINARQLMDRWAVVASPWPVGAEPPPAGPILLLDDTPLPRHWAARAADRHALPTTLPHDAIARIRHVAGVLDCREVRIVASPDLGTGAAGLVRQLPRVGLTVGPAAEPIGPMLAAGRRHLVVTDTAADRGGGSGDPRVLVLERGPAAGPLARVARELGWRPA